MPKVTITGATITIEGSDIKSKKDAVTALQVMLGCYEDMDSTDTEIHIKFDNKKMFKE